jgi:hypothetical protein
VELAIVRFLHDGVVSIDNSHLETSCARARSGGEANARIERLTGVRSDPAYDALLEQGTS